MITELKKLIKEYENTDKDLKKIEDWKNRDIPLVIGELCYVDSILGYIVLEGFEEEILDLLLGKLVEQKERIENDISRVVRNKTSS